MKYTFPTFILFASQASAHTEAVPHIHATSSSAVLLILVVSLLAVLKVILSWRFMR